MEKTQLRDSLKGMEIGTEVSLTMKGGTSGKYKLSAKSVGKGRGGTYVAVFTNDAGDSVVVSTKESDSVESLA